MSPESKCPLGLPSMLTMAAHKVQYCVWSEHQSRLQDASGSPVPLFYQIYIEFKESVTLEEAALVFPHAHWEKRRGSQKSAIDFVIRERTKNTEACEWGIYKEDLENAISEVSLFVKDVIGGMTMADLLRAYPELMARRQKFFKTVRDAFEVNKYKVCFFFTVSVLSGKKNSSFALLTFKEKKAHQNIFIIFFPKATI